VELKFKYYSIGLNNDEVQMLHKIVDEEYVVESMAIDDWIVVDLLYKKHIIIYDKTREKKPEIQPWCKSVVLRHLSSEPYGA
jgi:disulfide oxidoreductase YuzD